jgi:hypothetical protein
MQQDAAKIQKYIVLSNYCDFFVIFIRLVLY